MSLPSYYLIHQGTSRGGNKDLSLGTVKILKGLPVNM